jgi:glycine cleavage system H lipoate-binding protein
MESFHYVDIFATKGIEYLFVIVFLLVLVLFWRLLMRPRRRKAATAPVATGRGRNTWFNMRQGFYYHQGHTWAHPEDGDVVRVGIDDFAQKLLGPADALEAPAVGTSIEQGEKGWKLRIGTQAVDLLSPVDGEVVEVNEKVVCSPEVINEDPYEKGWLLKVRVPGVRRNLRNLLSGEVAQSWMEMTVRSLRDQVAAEMGPVLQDGGVPVSGMARALSPDDWEKVAADYLLTN